MAGQQLIIMRHAKSDWHAGIAMDFERPLNRRGRQDIPRMAQWLKNNRYIPQRLISSPAKRAQQTSRMLAEKMDLSEAAIIEVANIYEASLDDLCAVIDQYSGDVSSLLLVGHNPGLEELAYHLCSDKLPRSDDGKCLTTAAALILDYGSAPISSAASSARLERLIRPKELDQENSD